MGIPSKVHVQISGLPISLLSFDSVLNDMDSKIKERSSGNYISITNTESMYHALRDEDHAEYIRNANHSLCDGIGVCIAGKAWGVDVPRRNGPILMLHACEIGQKLGWRHFFYGGKDGVVELLEDKLKKKFPKLDVVGSYTPPYRDLTMNEQQEVVKAINDSKPDIIWVGLGLLKQESWINAWRTQVHVPWMVGVGAAFDYHAGTVPWAPVWVQKIGMEWLYRLMIQPKLRAKRYYWSFQFLFESMANGIMERVRVK